MWAEMGKIMKEKNVNIYKQSFLVKILVIFLVIDYLNLRVIFDLIKVFTS